MVKPIQNLQMSFTYLVLVFCLSHISHAQSTSGLSVSSDGSCGKAVNRTCLTSSYGDCCSLRGYCGSTNDFCNPTSGCQSAFGSCSTNTSFISYDGRCGSTDPNHQVCIDSTYGSCCSTKGWCGSTTDYCGLGCQSTFGTCGGANVTVNNNATSTSISSSATSDSASPSRTAAASSKSNDGPNVPMLALEITIGVLGVILLIGGIITVKYIYKPRRQPQELPCLIQEESLVDTKGCPCGRVSIYEAPPSRHQQTTSPAAEWPIAPVELGGGRDSRAELQDRDPRFYATWKHKVDGRNDGDAPAKK